MKKLILSCLLLSFPIFAAVDGSLKVLDSTFFTEKQFCLKGDSIFVEVLDGDLDTNGSIRETLYVHISSPTEPLGDSVKLIEDWDGQGNWVFRGAIAVDSSATPVAGDRKIQATVGQLITIRYNEEFNQYNEPRTHEKWLFFAKTLKIGGSASNEFWSKANGPYFISGPFTVNSGDTVTIEAGAKLFFGDALNINGHLIAEGTTGDSIYFNTISPTPTSGDWPGLSVYNGSIIARYCSFANSVYGIKWEYFYTSLTKNNIVRHSSFKRHFFGIHHITNQSNYISMNIDSNYIELFGNNDSAQLTGISSAQSASSGDIFTVRDNKILIHNTPANLTTGINIYGRDSSGPEFNRGAIERNSIIADSAYLGRSSDGLLFYSLKGTDVKNNRIQGFNRGVFIGSSNDGSVFEYNILTRNRVDCQMDASMPIRNNAFASNIAGGYAVYNNSWNSVDARNIYWGEATRAEMDGGGNPKNISRIYDKSDYSGNGIVDYAGWLNDTNGTPTPTGIDGIIQVQDEYFMPRSYFLHNENVKLRIIDGDLNANPSMIEYVKVRFQTGVESTDTLTLQEISMDSDTFEVLALVENLATPALKDGKIQVLVGQAIEFTYRDALNNYGASVDKKVNLVVPKTVVSSVSGKTVWNASNSPYWLDGNITVWAGDTLEIQQGTRVWMRANKSHEWGQYGDTLTVLGHLSINGISGDSVHIGPANTLPAPREWYGILVQQTGTISAHFAKITNAYTGVTLDYSYTGSNCYNRISHSHIYAAKTGIYGNNNESPGITLIIDSNRIESAPFDTGTIHGINLSYYYYYETSAGDSLLVMDNTITIYNNGTSDKNCTALSLSGRGMRPSFKPAKIMRNRILADTMTANDPVYALIGMSISDCNASIVEGNRITNFCKGINAYNDSAVFYTGNIITGNKLNVHSEGWSELGRYNYNTFAAPAFGGYSFYNHSSRSIDVRNNYWGNPVTSEMNTGGNPKNISVIYDVFDNGSKGLVQYAGWLNDTNGTPAVTGETGILKLAIHDTTKRDWYLPGDTMIVTLWDPNLNTNGSTTQSVKLFISSSQEVNDSIVLVEQGNDTALFAAAIIIQESGTPIFGDNKFQALPGSELTVRYQDQLNTFGQPQPIQREALLIKSYIAAGTLSLKTIFDNAGSPYFMDGNVIVTTNDTLTVQAGTKLLTRKRNKDQWWDNGDTLKVYGHLQVNGIEGDSVYFDLQHQDKAPGDWYGIRVENGGTCNIRYASFWNTGCALDIYTSNSDTNYVNYKLSNSKINNAKRGVNFYSNTSERMSLLIDSNRFDVVLPDSFGTDALFMQYNWSNGDSLRLSDNKVVLHNRSMTNNVSAIRISNRNTGTECVPAIIMRNSIIADSATLGSSNFCGIYFSQSKNIVVDTNEIIGFGTALHIADDSGIVIRSNKFENNFYHIQRGYSFGQSYANQNDFGSFRAGGYAVQLSSESNGNDFDARYNYWGSSVTTEMNGGGNPKNISSIYDFYDNPMCAKVLYSGWLLTSTVNIDTIRPVNPITLVATAISDSAISLSWNPSLLIGTDVDSVGIWATSTHFPDTAPYMGGVLYSHRFAKNDSTALVHSLGPKLGLYFSLFTKDSAGNWSTAGSQAFAQTLDLQAPEQVVGLWVEHLGADSVRLHWGSSNSTDVESLSICMRVDSVYPIDQFDGETGVVQGTVTTFKISALPENKTVRFSVYARDTAGNWSSSATTEFIMPKWTKPVNNLTLVATAISGSSVKLEWDTAPLTGTDITEILLYYGTIKPDSYNDTNSIHIQTFSAPFDTEYIADWLTEKTGYWFSLFVRDSFSNTSDTTLTAMKKVTTPDQTPPALITGQYASYLGADSIRLFWTPSISTDVEQVIICMRTDSIYPMDYNDGAIGTLAGDISEFKVTSLPEKRIAHFSFFVKDSSGNMSIAATTEINIPDYTKPANPLSLNAVAIDGNAVKLTWGDPTILLGTDAEWISIVWGDKKPAMFGDTSFTYSNTVVPITDTGVTIGGLTGKTDYWFTLFIRDSAFNYSDTTTASMKKVRTLDGEVPFSISALHADYAGLGKIILSWNPSLSTDAESVFVKYRIDSTYPLSHMDGIPLKNYSAAESIDTIYGLMEGTYYNFGVFVRDSSGNYSAADPSAQVEIFVKTPAVNVFSVTATATDTNSIAVRINYDGSIADSFLLRIDTASYMRNDNDISKVVRYNYLKNYLLDDTLVTYTGLKSGTLYFATIHAKSGEFWSDSIMDFRHDTAMTPTIIPVAPSFITMYTDTQQAVSGKLFTRDIDAVDANDDKIMYSFITSPTGMSMNDTTGLIRWIPSDSDTGVYTVGIRASDGLLSNDLSFKLMVKLSNKPPVFTSTITDTPVVYSDSSFNLLFTASDLNHDPLTFKLHGAPSGMSISASSGAIVWIPTTAQIGVHDFIVTVSDSEFADTAKVVIEVIIPNRPPIFVTQPDSIQDSIPEKILWTKGIKFTNLDLATGDKVSLWMDMHPIGMTLDSVTHQLSWLPTDSQIDGGPYQVRIRAIDTKGLEDTLEFSLSVYDVNEMPEFTAYASRDTAYQDMLFQYVYSAIDPDKNDVIRYKLVSAPTGMTIDSLSGRVQFTPIEGQFGNHTVKVVATDVRGLSDTGSVLLTMINRNDPPQITTVYTTETISEKKVKVWSLNATDPDVGDVLRWKILSAPPTAILDSVTRTVTWTPQNSNVGTSFISLTVSDKEGLSDTISYTVRVINVNDKPVIAVKEGPIVRFGSIKIKFKIDDLDRLNGFDSTLNVSAALLTTGTSLPLRSKELSLKGNDSLVEFYPVLDGNYTLTLTVKDDSLATTEVSRLFVVGASGQSIVSSSFRGDVWQMVAIPTDSTPIPFVLADTNRRTVTWSSKKRGYVDVQEGFTTLKRGIGFWLYSSDSVRVNAPRLLVDSAYTKPCTLRVDTGWNMIASPYAYAVKLSLTTPLSFWSIAKNDYDTGSVMEPWKGYFFYSFDGKPIVISGKPFNPDSTENAALGKVAKLSKETGEWLITVKAVSGGKVDFMNSLGVLTGVQAGTNALNMVQPPISPNGGPLAAFVSSTAKTLLDRSVVAPFKGTKEWLMYVEPSAGEKSLELSFEGVMDLPEGFHAYVDNSGECLGITDDSVVKLNLLKGHYLSVIVSDDPDFLSKRVTTFILAQNTPNPFNPSTVIRFALPRSYDANGRPSENVSNVDLSIFDLRGRLVKQLVSGNHKQGARYSVHWDGKDGRGKTLSSGIYIYRLEAGKWSGVRRMVMVK